MRPEAGRPDGAGEGAVYDVLLVSFLIISDSYTIVFISVQISIVSMRLTGTKVFEYCARESAQIFGGLSYTRGGQGEKVERLNREVRAMAIPGGSEEIMLDLGVRQTEKMAKMAKQMLGDGSKM